MVQYLYDQEHRAAIPPGYEQMDIHKKRQSNLEQHLECYYLADKYDIKTMKDHAAKKVKKTIEKESRWAVEYFPDTVKSILENTPESDRNLREFILKYCYDNLAALMMNPDFQQKMDSVDGFWKAMACKKAGHDSDSTLMWVRCPLCKQCFQLFFPWGRSMKITCFKCGNYSNSSDEWFDLSVCQLEDDEGSEALREAMSEEERSRKRQKVSAGPGQLLSRTLI